MAAWRILVSGFLVLAMAPLGQAQTYSLIETLKPGDCFDVHLDMNLAGEIKVQKADGPVSLKLAANGSHHFSERILLVGPNGVPQKVARVYETARAVITRAGERSERALRPERSLIVAQRPRDQTQVYSPSGPLTREELELTGEHLDTLALIGLLPGKAVALGETWKVSNEAVQSLCNFEGLTAQDLECKLEEVKDNVASFSLKGTASGIDLGAMAKLTIAGSAHFDLSTHRLVGLEWKQDDDRDQGPASPATNVKTTTTLKRSPIEEPSCLSDIALVPVPDGEAKARMMQLVCREPKGRFELTYGRDWQVVAETEEHLVLRLLDRGDFVAQLTVTPWTAAARGEHLTPQAFQEAMAATPGWEQQEVLQSEEVPTQRKGYWAYHVSAVGRSDAMELVQGFYLVAGPAGEQAVLTFTTTRAQAQKLGTRDQDLVCGLEFLTPDGESNRTEKKPEK